MDVKNLPRREESVDEVQSGTGCQDIDRDLFEGRIETVVLSTWFSHTVGTFVAGGMMIT